MPHMSKKVSEMLHGNMQLQRIRKIDGSVSNRVRERQKKSESPGCAFGHI